jgi:peptidoglycan/xylan/chitin deacetylase (PgdA/CDA1 family)
MTFSQRRRVVLEFKSMIKRLLVYSRVADVKLNSFKRDIVLLYHSVDSGTTHYPLCVSVENFTEQVGFLLSRYKVVSLRELFCSQSNTPRVAITFDDAYDDFYENVYPILQQAQAPTTVFVPTLYIESGHQYLEEEIGERVKHHLTWEQMREMRSSGLVEFESHTHSHYDSVSYFDELENDINLSMDIIERELGRRPKYFAYPFGSCNAATHEVVLSCGFEELFTTQSIPVKKGKIQGRYNIWRSNEKMGLFKLTIAGINLDSIRKLEAHLNGERKSDAYSDTGNVFPPSLEYSDHDGA